VQPQRHLLRIPLCIQGQQPSQHVIPHGIGPAVAPGEFAAAGDGAVGLQLALEIKGFTSSACRRGVSSTSRSLLMR
jgi:hypothetical protein